MEKVQRLVRSDRQLNTCVITEELNLDRETARKILTEDLEMRKYYAKIGPRILTDEKK